LLTRVIHHASYMTSPNSAKDIDSADPKAAPVVVFDLANSALTASEGIGLLSDSFTVRFQGSGNGVGTPDGTVADCQGREIDAKQFAVNTFTIAVGANGRNALFCNNGVANREVVADVENMQLVFAEDTSSPRDGSAERYLPIGGVTNINNIVAVRVALLFQTPNIAATVVTEPNRTYDLNGVVLGPFLDKRIRRVVATTINLRNRTR
jgi:type IV pilus assembly protein PilW